MIQAIGIDAVDIERFSQWHTKSLTSLRRIFSEAEIAYALENSVKSAERFAVRFAAKEAFLKAVQQLFPTHIFSLLKILKYCSVEKTTTGQPYLIIDWHQLLGHDMPTISHSVSLTHTHTTAFAVVLLYKRSP
jgi:phosphopantetheine--protein transferase-like protein